MSEQATPNYEDIYDWANKHQNYETSFLKLLNEVIEISGERADLSPMKVLWLRPQGGPEKSYVRMSVRDLPRGLVAKLPYKGTVDKTPSICLDGDDLILHPAGACPITRVPNH